MAERTYPTKFDVLRPGASVPETREVELAGTPTYDELKALLCVDGLLGDGVTLGHVAILRADGKPGDIFCDDDFRQKGLPYNELGTREYHRYAESRKRTNPNPICGVAVLFHRRVWF